MDQINTRQNVKLISTFGFTTLYTKLPYNDLLKVLFDLIYFGFNGGWKKQIDFSWKNAFWSNKLKTKSFFTKTTLKRTVLFVVGDVLLVQTVSIPMGIDPAPFWCSFYFYNYKSRYIANLIRANNLRSRRFYSTSWFILCALNDGGEFIAFLEKWFRRWILLKYVQQLELKEEHNDSYATSLDMDISIDKGKFTFKMLEKRDALSFHVVRMPSITSNIPSIIFYSFTISDFVRINRSILLL